jgi:hypothetical protein
MEIFVHDIIQLLTALAAVVAAVSSMINHTKINKVQDSTNGMKDELIISAKREAAAITAAAAARSATDTAAGIATGRAIEKSNNAG